MEGEVESYDKVVDAPLWDIFNHTRFSYSGHLRVLSTPIQESPKLLPWSSRTLLVSLVLVIGSLQG